MKYLETYLKTIEGRGNKQLADSIRKTVDNIAPKYLEEFSFCEHEVGLLFGNVQSGKTGQMFGVISVAADLGFPVFLILTTDNVIRLSVCGRTWMVSVYVTNMIRRFLRRTV